MRPGGLELLREAGNSAGIATFVAGEDWDSGSRNLREPGKNIFTLFFYPNLSIFYCFVHVYMFIITNRGECASDRALWVRHCWNNQQTRVRHMRSRRAKKIFIK